MWQLTNSEALLIDMIRNLQHLCTKLAYVPQPHPPPPLPPLCPLPLATFFVVPRRRSADAGGYENVQGAERHVAALRSARILAGEEICPPGKMEDTAIVFRPSYRGDRFGICRQ